MKVWSGILNFIAIIMIMCMWFVYVMYIDTVRDNFEATRLAYQTELAAKAAFVNALDVEDIDIEYLDMGAVKLNPGNCLDVFTALMGYNYGMAPSYENKVYVESFIPCAVLACNDGYYITDLSNVDTTGGNLSGAEYQLKWSVKKPYTMGTESNLVAVNMYDDSWIRVKKNGADVVIDHGEGYDTALPGKVLTRNEILSIINNQIARDVNLHIKDANEKNWQKEFTFTLPSAKTASGINEVNRPSLLIIVQGADFNGRGSINTATLSGYKTERKRVVVGFTDMQGVPRYCYEGQLDDSMISHIQTYFTDIESAAKAGYSADYTALSKKIEYNKDTGMLDN